MDFLRFCPLKRNAAKGKHSASNVQQETKKSSKQTCFALHIPEAITRPTIARNI
jgi:hypothetical protein